MGRITDFRELEIWINSKDLAIKIYQITLKGMFNKDYGLRDQVRRSAVLVPSNIAEGFGRANNKEFVNF